MKRLLKRAIRKIISKSNNIPFHIDSDEQREIYPNKWMIEQGRTEVSHIILTDKYHDARVLVEYFNLDSAKVVFFVRTDAAEVPYSNPIGILKDTDSKELPFVYTRNGLSLDTYIFGIALTPDIYGCKDEIIGHDSILGYYSVEDKRNELNSIFDSIPTEISLMQSMFGNGQRKLPNSLVKYLSKLEVTEKDSLIFYALVYGDESFRENLKAFEEKYREAKAKATKLILDEKMLFDLIAEEIPEFAKVWKTEKRREKFIRSNELGEWFLDKLNYLQYSAPQSSYFDNKIVKNSFKYLIYSLEELYNVFIKGILEFELINLDFSEKILTCSHFIKKNARKKDIARFFDIVFILDSIGDGKISFVNMSSENPVREQIDLDAAIVIVKLPVIDSENKELNLELRTKAEESFHKGLVTLGIEAKVFFF